MPRISFALGLLSLIILAGCGGGNGSSTASNGAANGITSISIFPASAIVRTGRTREFVFRIEGTGKPDTSVVWSADNGTIDNNGIYRATGNQSIAHVTVKSVSDPTKVATATITVSDTAGPTFDIVNSAALPTLDQHFFSVAANGIADLGTGITVVGAANPAITWSVVSAGGGTINANGRYQAPGTNGTYLIQYSSVADPTQVDYVSAVVGPLPSGVVTGTLSISPPLGANGMPLQVLTVGRTYRFGYAITLQNSSNTSVTWAADNGATIGSDGTFVAPRPGTYTVTVTSVASGQSASTTETAR